MSFKRSLITIVFLAAQLVFASEHTPVYCLNASHDLEALAFCKQTPKSYVVIIWPRGFNHIETIIKTLNHHGTVAYVKEFKLTKPGSFLLYRHLHLHMSLKSAQHYFKSYIPSTAIEPIDVAAIVLYTDKSLIEIQNVKQQMRTIIGCGYQSLHINDFQHQTIKAAELVFNNHELKKINRKKTVF